MELCFSTPVASIISRQGKDDKVYFGDFLKTTIDRDSNTLETDLGLEEDYAGQPDIIDDREETKFLDNLIFDDTRQLPCTGTSDKTVEEEEEKLYVWLGNFNEATMPESRTLEMKKRQHAWFLVVYRDLKALVEELKVSPPPPASSSQSTSSNDFIQIDGARFADSDAMQDRFRRIASLLRNAFRPLGLFEAKRSELMRVDAG